MANNPLKVPVQVFDAESGELLFEFESKMACARWAGMPETNVKKYIDKNQVNRKVLNGRAIIFKRKN